MYLGVEEQVLPDGEVVKQNVMLGAQTQTAANQSHVLADVIAIDVGPPTGRWVQTWVDTMKEKPITFLKNTAWL